jgi:histidyl-tRNA synthetase
MRAAEDLRDAGLDVVLHAGDGGLKSQMRKADASGAEFAVIVGEAEAAQQSAAVKGLRERGDHAPFAMQTVLPLAQIGDALVSALERLSEQG